MSTKFDARQVESKDSLPLLSPVVDTDLDVLLRSANSNAKPPLELTSTGLNRVVNIDSISVTNPVTLKNYTTATIGGSLPNFLAGTITAPATTPGNMTVSAGAPLAINMAGNEFLKIGININSVGDIVLVPGTVGATALLSIVPAPMKGIYAIGHVVLRSSSGNTFPTNIGTGPTPAGTADILVYQTDGKYLVGGSFTSYSGTPRGGLLRLNGDGTSDTAFNANLGAGFVGGAVLSVVVQSDGKILVGGNFTTVSGAAAVRFARLNADGTTDSTFGLNMGLAVGFNASVTGIAVQPSDGGIVIVGNFSTLNGAAANRVVRVSSIGAVDSAFSVNVGSGLNTNTNQVAVDQIGGNIILTGSFTLYNGSVVNKIARLTSSGILDTAFATAMGTGPNSGALTNAKPQNDGSILILGSFTAFSGVTNYGIVKLDTTGAPVLAFNLNAATTAVVNGAILNTATNNDGSIVVVGSFTQVNAIPNTASILKLDPSGVRDAAWYASVPAPGFVGSIVSIAIQTDDKIIVAGQFTFLGGQSRKNITRLNNAGTEDSTTSGIIQNILQSDIHQYVQDVENLIIPTQDDFLETIKASLRDGAWTLATPVIFNQIQSTLTDATSSATYDIVTTDYTYTAAGQFVLTKQLLDSAEFLTTERDVQSVQVLAQWQTGFVDTSAVYQVSRNGGVDLQTITMSRIGQTNIYTGTKVFTEEASSSSLVTQSITNTTTTLDTTTRQSVAQAAVLASASVLKKVDLYITKAGTPLGNMYVQIIRNSGGLPSTSLSDLINESAPISIAGLAAGLNTITIPDTVVQAGTYHIAIRTDSTYKTQYTVTAGASNVQIQMSSTADGSTQYNGTTWSDPGTTGFKYTLKGRILDLRVKITSSTNGRRLMGIGAVYDLQSTGIIGGIKNREVFGFNSTSNPNQFVLTRFRPDPDLLSVYLVQTGQVFKAPSFTLSGSTIVFPVNTFNNGGTPMDYTLVFEQANGASFDNSDVNAMLLAANFLGSADPQIDRSAPGRGIFLRRPDGVLKEITINNSNAIVVI